MNGNPKVVRLQSPFLESDSFHSSKVRQVVMVEGWLSFHSWEFNFHPLKQSLFYGYGLDGKVEGGPLQMCSSGLCRQSLRFNIHPLKQSSFYVSGLFGRRRGGTPYKRVPEGFGDNACVLIFSS